jgi:SAM-dependent methyltransferase
VESDHTEVEARLLDDALKPGSVALDAGCGRTTRLRNFRDRIVRVVGVDLDGAAGRENPYLDEFVVADLSKRLPFDDAAFDLVYANFVVEHLVDPERTFAEWRRVLKPDGRLVLLTSNRASPLMVAADRMPQRVRLLIKRRGAGAVERDVFPTRYRANTPDRLAELARSAEFEPVSVNYVGTLHRYAAKLPPLAWLIRGTESLVPLRRRSTIVASYRPA